MKRLRQWVVRVVRVLSTALGWLGLKRAAAAWKRFKARRLATVRQRVLAVTGVIAVLAGIIIPIIASQQKAEAWWDSGWSYRRKITFDNSAGGATNLVNFPVRVSLDATNISYANTKAAGADIRFVDSDDSTALSYEIESWNSSGTSEVWVKVPQVNTGTADYIYMYYGNGSASDAQSSSGVWDSNYTMVMHLKESGAGTANEYKDSTSYNKGGQAGGGSANTTYFPTQTTGEIGNGQDFDGSNDAINIDRSGGSNDVFNANTNYTFEAWLKPDDCGDPSGGSGTFFEHSNNIGELYLCKDGSGGVNRSVALYYNNSGNQAWTTANAVTFGVWQHVVITHVTAGTTTVYVNGTAVTMATGSVAGDSTASTSAVLGADELAPTNSSYNYDGGMDEVRTSNTNRSAAWIKASYLSESNQMNSFGSEESNGPPHWWNSSWLFRRKITFNNSASGTNLVNFPARVSLTSANITYASTKASGADVRFVDADDTTALNYEIEGWNNGGTSEVWVNVPQIDAGSTTDYIWMYYGNAAATHGQNANGTWNSSYMDVQHMNGGTTSATDYKDSTSNGNNNTTGSLASSSSGQIDRAAQFSGSNNIQAPDSASLDSSISNLTVSTWVRLNDDVTEGQMVCKVHSVAPGFSYLIQDNNTDFSFQVERANGSAYREIASTTNPQANIWYNVVGTYASNGTMKMYVNGVDVSTGSTGSGTGTIFDADSNMYLGYLVKGLQDETRISNVALSADWVKADYLTQTNTMNTFGSEEVYSGGIQNGADKWWDSGWQYRRKITIDNSASGTTLANFPVRVSLSSSRIDYANAQSAGQDIRFVAPDGTTQYNYEIEGWNPSGTSDLWVKVPSLANTNTNYMYMYYGNATATDAQQPTAVWDQNFQAVYHTKETTGTGIGDSTANGRNGAKASATQPSPTTSGQIGGAQTFANSTTNSINISNVASSVATGSLSFHLWFKPGTTFTSSKPNDQMLINLGDAPSNNDLAMYLDSGSGSASAYIVSSSNVAAPTSTTETSWTAGTWYFLEGTYSAATGLKLYMNGNIDGTNAVNTRGSTASQTVFLGKYYDFSLPFDGSMDEVRISNTARSADWVKAEYLTETDAMNTYGLKEIYPPDAPVLTALTTSASTTPTFQMRASDQRSPNYLQYKIDVCADSACSSIVRTIDQTVSQTGWTGQDAAISTAYVASATLGSSTLASHVYQAPALTAGTQYWWRAYAIDPADSGSFSAASAIGTFTTQGPPATPVLTMPISGIIVDPNMARFEASSTDANSDNLKYKFDICSTSNCSSVVRTVDQTSSQTGWTNQSADSGTSYKSSPVAGQSQRGAYSYQTPFLSPSTQYWWRAYAIDPGGSNTWTSASSIDTFTTGNGLYQTKVNGGTDIRGGTVIGH